MAPDATSVYPPVFIQAVTRVLGNEGGFSSDANDPGGTTNFGISHRDYPQLDIANLTRDDAIAIYFRDFWNKARYAELPAAIAMKLFDLGGEHGSGARDSMPATRIARMRGEGDGGRCAGRSDGGSIRPL
jgi:lysozyme family protein